MTTTKRVSTLNSSNFVNFNEPKIIRNYEQAPREAVGEAAAPAHEDKSQISFAKAGSELAFEMPEVKNTISTDPAPEKSPQERRAERRDTWKSAADVQRRAMQMQKEAEEKIRKANEVSKLLEEANSDPTAVARALNMDPNEFLKKYQNKMFDIPNEPVQSTEDLVQARLQKYDEERQREREQFASLQSQTIKQNYVSNKILPIIMTNPDKFEILNNDDPNMAAAVIYDMMNDHYAASGEELNAEDVAEELENLLAKELEERITKVQKYKKFSKYFKELPEEPTQLGDDNQIRRSVQDNQLGGREEDVVNTRDTVPSHSPRRTHYETIEPTKGQDNSGQKNHVYLSKKEQRLANVTKRVLGGQ